MPSAFHGLPWVYATLLCFSMYTVIDASLLGKRTASPIVVSPSQDWDGNDGPWSSFALQAGTPAQNVKVMISTAGTQTWLVANEGCTTRDPSNCGTLRGGFYNFNQSSTYVPNLTNVTSNIYNLSFEASLGYSGFGRYGFDDITLGWQGSGGPVLKNQTVAGIATKDFYLGIFGLTPRPSNFSGFNNPIPSYMENLRNQSLIPSTSWSYTAGNQYRLDKVLGSLTLGGYDSSKFIPNTVSFPFNQQDARDLTVSIDSITKTNVSASLSLLPKAASAFIDSTVSQIWLPTEACTLFESAFNLTWDEDAQLYLVTGSQHQRLLSENANITFTLSNFQEKVNITLPYSAFDLTAQYPLVNNDTRYFPLKRATSASQYTLGRAFLQEAYVIVDYDRRNFSVSQCNWTPNAQQSIKTILPPSSSTSSNSTSTPGGSSATQPSKSSGLGGGAIAGIAIAGVLILLGAAFLFFYLRVLKPRRSAKAAELEASARSDGSDPSEPNTGVKPDHDTLLSPELEGAETKGNVGGIFETDGMVKHEMESPAYLPEMEAQGTQIFEMPAREEVAAEMIGASHASEMEGNGENSQDLKIVEERRRVELVESPWSPQPPPEEKWEDRVF